MFTQYIKAWVSEKSPSRPLYAVLMERTRSRKENKMACFYFHSLQLHFLLWARGQQQAISSNVPLCVVAPPEAPSNSPPPGHLHHGHFHSPRLQLPGGL